MKKYNKKMFMGALGGFQASLTLLFFSLVLLWLSNMNEMKAAKEYWKAEQDIAGMKLEEMRDYQYYKCDITALAGMYAQDENGDIHKGGKFYILPTADGSYIGCLVYGGKQKTADKILQDSQVDIKLKSISPSKKHLKGRGILLPEMQEAQGEKFYTWLKENGVKKKVLENLTYRLYVILPAKEVMGLSPITWYEVLFLVLAFLGIYLIFSIFTGGYKRKLYRQMKRMGITAEELEEDLDGGMDFKRADVGKRYALCYSYPPFVLDFNELVWSYIYIKETRHYVYLIYTGTSYERKLYFVTRKDTLESVSIKNEQEGRDILTAIREAAPHLLYGYDEELQKMRKKDFSKMCSIVEMRKELYQEAKERGMTLEELLEWKNRERAMAEAAAAQGQMAGEGQKNPQTELVNGLYGKGTDPASFFFDS